MLNTFVVSCTARWINRWRLTCSCFSTSFCEVFVWMKVAQCFSSDFELLFLEIYFLPNHLYVIVLLLKPRHTMMFFLANLRWQQQECHGKSARYLFFLISVSKLCFRKYPQMASCSFANPLILAATWQWKIMRRFIFIGIPHELTCFAIAMSASKRDPTSKGRSSGRLVTSLKPKPQQCKKFYMCG